MLQGLASTLSSRLTSAALTFPATRQWVQVGYVLGTTAAIALPVGFASRFLEVSPVRDVGTVVRGAAIAFLVPGISEEVLFRAALLPHPRVDPFQPPLRYALSAALPLAIFVAYHLINPDPRARGVFTDWRFLSLAGALGAACTASYYLTGGSLLAAAVTHWVPVCAWLFLLGGWQKLRA